MKEEAKNKIIVHKRIINLDIARTLAIMCVVLCHSVELIYNMNLETWLILSQKARIYKTIMFTIGRLGVPIFLLLSGYLLLSKTYENDEDVFKFYKKNLLSLIITIEAWIIIYNVFLSFYNKISFNIIDLVKEMTFFKAVPLMNMWYMPMIIGIYIAIPYVSNAIKCFSFKSLKVPIITIFIIIFIIPTINIIVNKHIWNIIDTSFLGGIYGIYIVIGYFIQRDKLKDITKKRLLLITIISFLCSCLIQIYAFNNYIEYNIWYDSPFILICSTCLFELIKRLNNTKIPDKIINIVTYISKISLGIFFVHVVVELILKDYIKIIPISNHFKVELLFVSSLIVCVIIVWLFSKIKMIRKVLFRG